ncbi:hypothetical protein Tco_1049657 [Tanacetum coccineum]
MCTFIYIISFISAPIREDFNVWYLDVIAMAAFVDYGPVRGTMVIRPYSYAIWESVREKDDVALTCQELFNRLCQCEKEDRLSLQDGLWSSFMPPYESKYVDVKFGGKVTSSVTVGLDEGLLAVVFTTEIKGPIDSFKNGKFIRTYVFGHGRRGMLAPIYIILARYGMKLPQLMPSRIRLQGTLTRYEVRLTLENAWSKVLGFAAKVVLIKDITIIVADESTQESISK